MQVGAPFPFSSPSLMDAFKKRANDNQERESSINQDTQDARGSNDDKVDSNDHINALKKKLVQESEPSALEKLQANISRNILEKLQNFHQLLNPQKKDNNFNALPPQFQSLDAQQKTKEKEDTAKVDENKATESRPIIPALDIKDFNAIPMNNFQTAHSMSYEATYDAQTGIATQQAVQTTTYNFSFSGVVTDKNGNKYNIEANVTLTRSFYTKVVGNADSLSPEVLKELQNGKPFEVDYEGDGRDLANQDFAFLFDDLGEKDQLTANKPLFSKANDLAGTSPDKTAFGALIDKAFGDGLGSMLEGLRVFAFGGDLQGKNDNTASTLPPETNKDGFNSSHLIGLGEKGIGLMYLTQMQRELFFSMNGNNATFGTRFNFQSTYISYLDQNSKDFNTLEKILRQKNLDGEKNHHDAKKAIDSYLS